MLVADLSNLSSATVYGLDQYDYGQKLELHGLSLPEAVEVHFAIKDSAADAKRRVGITKDGVTTVEIPMELLEQSKPIIAYVYVTDAVSGKTVRRVTMPINPRQKPQDFVSPGDPLKEDPFKDAVMAVADAAGEAKTSEKSAEAWAHGSEDYPGRDTDNARYYAEQAGADAERAEQVYTRTEKELAVILANAANYAAESKSAKEAAEGFAEAAEGHKNDAEKILNDVENVGAAKVEAIEKKGAETLGSIPEDYTALQGEVTELKDDLEQLKQNGTGTGTGLSTEAIDKLEEVGNYLAYTTADGGSKWTELISILRNGSSGGGSGDTDVTLTSISAMYTGGEVATGTVLTDLTGITVTASYSDGSTSIVTGYTLSGEILEGDNTITVSYGGKTTTFTVTGVAESSGGDDSGDTSELMDIITDVEWTDGIWLNNNGAEVTNANYTASEKIPFSASETVTCVFNVNNLKAAIYCYDSSDSFLGSVVTPSYSIVGKNQTLTALENTAYIRTTMTIRDRTSGKRQMLITAREV